MADFYKYHGLGNDFVVVEGDGRDADPEWVRRVCDRHRGVGADGVLWVGPPRNGDSDGTMILHNRDGTRPEMCGNGIRCVVRHLVERGDVEPSSDIAIDTDAGTKRCRVESDSAGDWQVAVEMGRPEVDHESIERTVAGRTRRFWRVDIGNPHAVTFGGASDEVVDRFGAAMNAPGDEAHPQGVNVEFVEPVGEATAEVVVFERGVGRTEACGTGACAAAAASWQHDRLDRGQSAAIHLPGGTLRISEEEGAIWMSGPVAAVFFGEFTTHSW